MKVGDLVKISGCSKDWDGLGVVEGFYSNRDVSINFCHRVGYFSYGAFQPSLVKQPTSREILEYKLSGYVEKDKS